MHARRLPNLLKRIPISSETEILDAGCGDGGLRALLGSDFKGYVGIDHGDDEIARTDRSFDCPKTTFIKANLLDYRIEGTFDVVVALDVCEHLRDEHCLEIFSLLRTNLKPGGRLYLHTPNRAFFLERLKARGFLPQTRIREHHGESHPALQSGSFLDASAFAPAGRR